MSIAQIFNLFLEKKDRQAINKIAETSLVSQPEVVINYLEQRLITLQSLAELEVIDLVAHYCQLSIIDRQSQLPVTDFQPVIIDIIDLATYNRCGRRELQPLTSEQSFTFWTEAEDQEQTVTFEEASSFLSIQKNASS
ncbi:hypothetical protein [Vagococcus salmoninarum]|uniref:hypothetical protein n=1 Tax=Vagococcus salmoninarum TaxID=2739 RepID=UPI0028D18CD0|nr:hypothetical protein [Vagococcus salmoninarum]